MYIAVIKKNHSFLSPLLNVMRMSTVSFLSHLESGILFFCFCVMTLSNLLEFWLCENLNLCSAVDFKDGGGKMAMDDEIF